MITKRHELDKKMKTIGGVTLLILVSWGALASGYADPRQRGWSIETVEGITSVGKWSSLTLDSNDYPHISYGDETNSALKYAYKDMYGWHNVTVDNTGEVGKYTSLAIDSSGYPRISYYERISSSNSALKFAYLDMYGWHNFTVDSNNQAGGWSSLVLNDTGYPHISYFEQTYQDLKYAYLNDTGWHIVTADSNNTGSWSSIALDSNGYPHISHCGGNLTCDLKYTYQDISGWHTETVYTAGDIGCWGTSLVLDSSGYPCISFFDATNSALKYAYKDMYGWNIVTVDNTGDTGRYPSLALDNNDYPHISYYDTSTALKYAYWNGTGWNIATVDSTGDVGEYTSLALDTGGYPHISYYDDTNNDLKYAKYSPPNIPVVSIDPASSTINQGNSFCIDIMVNSDGTPVQAVDLHLYYSSPGFTVDSMTYGGLLGTAGQIVDVSSDDGAGDINIALARLSGNPASPVNGNLYTICFTGPATPGTYVLDLDAVTLTDASSNPIPNVTVTDGTVTVMPKVVVDDILITFESHNEIPNEELSTNFSFDCYASAFNNTYGFIDFIDVNWAIQNSGGSNASLNTTLGSRVKLYTGWYDGTATITIDNGSSHSDSVVFTIDQDMDSMVIGTGWNLIGWSQEYDTDAETLGQYIPGCTVVIMYDWAAQEFLTHVVGVPHDNFIITRHMGLFVYTTETSIWDGTV